MRYPIPACKITRHLQSLFTNYLAKRGDTILNCIESKNLSNQARIIESPQPFLQTLPSRKVSLKRTMERLASSRRTVNRYLFTATADVIANHITN
ncbi:predicted protein [Sclerotinia sclerotiorum 1980 UF-70]|uniref:Uncharacterized protein n=1 Tax=Sclerotinia sclerotiorum (strain ATCC 18683 / 1980 / Ss-1) TaxID=665079 RepID=A7EG36_SCLS1|nr:predicted protein [Sclerotinia sclerotiorum 1980 UF-70]EDO01802.1 predicted protein [Sclerotinia sclerotiorum 1980 UF-70]